MFRMKQKSLFKLSEFTSEFGGSLLKNKRKSARPLSTRLPIHMTMKCTGPQLLKNADLIAAYIRVFAKRFQVKVYNSAIESNHIHLAIKCDSKAQIHNFMRALTGTLSKMLKLKWLYRPYTRIVKWGREFRNVCEYVTRNHFEAIGVIDYKPRKKKRPG